MKKKAQLKLTIISFIILVGIFSVFVLAQSTNYKTYDKPNQIVSIYDSKDILLGKLQLLTPKDNLVPRGYQQVA